MRVVPILLVALFLVAPLAHASPNAREETLDAAGPILGLAVADGPVLSGAGRFVVATEDPAKGTAAPKVTNANAPVWYMWDDDGDQIWSDHADRTNCVQRTEDDCVSDAVAVSVSDNGRRMVVISHIDPISAPTVADDTRTMVLFIDASTGIVARTSLKDAPVDVAVSGDGASVAVLTAHPAAPGGDGAGHVTTFTWPSGAVGAPVRDSALPGAATGLVMGSDGGALAAVGEQFWYFASTSLTAASTSAITQAALAGAMGDGAKPYTVVGFAKGTVALYDDSLSSDGKQVPVFSRQPASEDILSVATASDASWFAAGDAKGSLHLFRLTPDDAVKAQYMNSFTVGTGGVRELEMSADGQYIAFRIGDEIQFHRWDGKNLSPVWKDTPGAGVGALAMDGPGDLLAAAVGSSVTVYEALHRVVGVPPAVQTIDAGVSTSIKLQIRNEGNRGEEVAFAVQAPDGWGAKTDKSTLLLDVGQSGEIVLDVDVPAGTAAGRYTLNVDHTLRSGPTGTVAIDVDVPLVEAHALVEKGSRSISIEPGQFGAFEFTVQNLGNAPAEVVLVIQAEEGWKASLSEAAFSLPVGASKDLMLTVQAPTGLADGTSGMFQVSTGEQSLDFTATAGAVFGLSMSLPKGLQANIGNETPVELSVTNKGNAPDSVLLTVGPLPSGWVLAFPSGIDTYTVADIEPGATQKVPATLRIAEGAEVGARHVIDINGVSKADPLQEAKASTIVTVLEGVVATECPSGKVRDDAGECVKEAPGLALVGVLLALVAVAFARRRR